MNKPQTQPLSEDEKALVGEYLEIILQIAMRVHKKRFKEAQEDDKK